MKNLIGLHCGYWLGSGITGDMSKIISYTKSAGADIIELSMGDLVKLDDRELLRLRNDVESVGLSIKINGGLVTIDNDISSPDIVTRERGFAHCLNMLRICSIMGSKTWSGLIHSAWLLRPDPVNPIADKEKRLVQAINGMKRVTEIAEKADVRCCLEIVNRYEQFLFNTVEEGVLFCQAVDSPYCQLLLDTFHMSIEEDNLAASILRAQKVGLIGYIHIGETNRRIPLDQSGNTNWLAFKDAVNGSGYVGPLVLEPLELANSDSAIKTCTWRSYVDGKNIDLMLERAKSGIAFLRSL